MPNTNYDIFISFKDLDDEGNRTEASRLAERIYNSLYARGYDPFYSRRTLEGMGGIAFEKEINHALDCSKLLVIVYSDAEQVNSDWVRTEWLYFLRRNKPVIPVLLNCGYYSEKAMPPEIKDLQYVDLTGDSSDYVYTLLLNRISEVLSEANAKPGSSDSSSQGGLKSSFPDVDADSLYELGEMQADFDGEEHDYKRAFESYIKAANAGHAEANYRIGYMYANGLGVKKDLSRAVSWYEKAAGYGNSDIMFRVGEFTYKNNYHKKAFIWFEKAVKAGHVEAMVSFGKMLQADMGIRSDKDNKVKAFGWFSKAAELGNDEAMRMLGYMYENGFGVDSDIEKAIECYTKAAEAGNTEAMRNIANMYNWGWGVNKDGQKAIEWYTRALNAGEYYALIDLARLYESGIIIEKDNAKAYELYAKAAEWYTKEAEAGDTHAMHIIANMYENGNGVEQNYEKSIEWYTKAAEAGDTYAMIDIGMIHDYAMDDYNKAVEWYSKAGKYGDPDYIFCRIGWRYDIGFCSLRANWRKAVEWYTKAANVGSIEAMKSLGRIYCKKEDYDKAIEWYTKAADFGDSEAMREVGMIYEKKLEELYVNLFGYGISENIDDSFKVREQIIEWYTKAVKAGDDRSKRKLEYYQGNKDLDYRTISRYRDMAIERRNSKK